MTRRRNVDAEGVLTKSRRPILRDLANNLLVKEPSTGIYPAAARSIVLFLPSLSNHPLSPRPPYTSKASPCLLSRNLLGHQCP